MNIDMAALRGLEREKEISFDLLVEAIETALLIAYHHTEGAQPHARVELDRNTGDVAVLAQESAEDGESRASTTTPPRASAASPPAPPSRSSCSGCARPRASSYGEYAGREGDIVSGIVQQARSDPARRRTERHGRARHGEALEAVLPPTEQVPGENYDARQPAQVLRRVGRPRASAARRSPCRRTHPDLVRGLFALEVPEIADGSRRDRGDRPRGRAPHQDRRPLDGRRAQRQGRLHRPDRLAGPRGHDRAARREDRHRRLVRGPGPLRGQRAVAGPGEPSRSSTRCSGRRGSSCPTTSSRSPSARRARTPASPPG